MKNNNLLKFLLNISRSSKQILVLINDIIISVVSTFVAISIRQDELYLNFIEDILVFVLSSFIFIPFFIAFGLYLAIFRFTGYKYLIHVFYACASYGICFFGIIFFAKFESIPRSIGILQPLLFFILIIYSRILFVQLIRYLSINNNEKNLLIYGANSSGVLLFENLIDYNVVGFVDSDINKKGKKINNINIYHDKDLDFILKSHKIFSIVISDIDLELSKKRELISKLEKYKVAVRILPNYDSIISKKFTFSDFRRVGIDELIDRKITLDRNKIFNYFNNQDILVTGAGGSIGSEISKQLIKMKPNKIILLDHSE